MAEVTQSTPHPRLVFISHNKADKDIARSLAQALIDQGISVWFDEWEIRPGDSITGAIQDGLAATDLVVLVWSKDAARSRWVKEELSAVVYRRIADGSVRVAPILLDETPLPAMVAGLLHFRVREPKDVLDIAAKLGGDATATELARRLQERFFEMLDRIGKGVSVFEYRFCPNCGSPELESWQQTDDANDRTYAGIHCKKCRWDDGGEI